MQLGSSVAMAVAQAVAETLIWLLAVKLPYAAGLALKWKKKKKKKKNNFIFYVCVCFSFLNKVHLYYFLFSTYKLISYIIAFLWLISLTMIVSRSIHVAANGKISFFFMAE